MKLEQGTFKTVPGLLYGTPKEVWGFRSNRGSGTPLKIARSFLRSNRKLLGLTNVKLKHRKTYPSLGAYHVVFEQRFEDHPVRRAYVSVHIQKTTGRVYLVKNRATPWKHLPDDTAEGYSERRAQNAAIRNRKLERSDCEGITCERVWYPYFEEVLLAYKVRFQVVQPRQEWIIFVNATDREVYTDAGSTIVKAGDILDDHDNIARAAPQTARPVSGEARVFNPNPVVRLRDNSKLIPLLDKKRKLEKALEPAYSNVILTDLDGNGRLEGKRVSIKQAGERAVYNKDNRFLFKSNQEGFEEVMAYYHINEAIRYLESLGFKDECAIFKKPLAVSIRETDEDSSFYSAHNKQLYFGLGEVNDAEDGDTILHELGHAVQDAIVPQFGLSKQSEAMGEGFGDYLALSFFEDRKLDLYRTRVMTWDGILYPNACMRNLNSGLTFECFDWSNAAKQHQNGRIWGETLWDIRNAVGRKKADTIIVESHYQLDPHTTFARGARAIIDADRHLYGGKSRKKLLQIFHERGIGPVL